MVFEEASRLSMALVTPGPEKYFYISLSLVPVKFKFNSPTKIY